MASILTRDYEDPTEKINVEELKVIEKHAEAHVLADLPKNITEFE